MEELIKLSGEKLVDLFNRNIPEWNSGIYTVIATPAVNVSYSAGPPLFGTDKSEAVIDDIMQFVSDDELNHYLVQIFKSQNLTGRINKITYVFEDRTFLELKSEWDQSVQDEFELYLPKSKKGKIKAWYLPSHEELISDTGFKKVLENHLSKIAATEPVIALKDIQNKDFKELISMYRSYVEDQDNPLWDGGLIVITREPDGKYRGRIVQQYAATEEDRRNGYSTSEEQSLDKITGSMIVIYEAIQTAVQEHYPSARWDTVAVSFYRDGFIEANFELNGEEVEIG